MIKEKIKSVAFFLFLAVLSFGFAALKYPVDNSFVLAEDEGSEGSEGSGGSEGGSEGKYEYVTETVIVTPSRTVYEEQTLEIALPDIDRDGIADENDPHPDVAEIYVVKDEDKDGIDDEYERFFEKIRIAK